MGQSENNDAAGLRSTRDDNSSVLQRAQATIECNGASAEISLQHWQGGERDETEPSSLWLHLTTPAGRASFNLETHLLFHDESAPPDDRLTRRIAGDFFKRISTVQETL